MGASSGGRLRLNHGGKRASVRMIRGVSAGERVVARESIQVSALWHEANGESF